MNFLSIENLSKEYPTNQIGIDNYNSTTMALRGITFQIKSGEILALVGESGSGKTTLARCILRFIPTDRGRVVYLGQNILQLSDKEFGSLRPKFQMIFQDPTLALNPRQTVGEVIEEPLKIIKGFKDDVLRKRIHQLLDLAGLERDLLSRYPYQLSGGQKQKVVIARALTTEPDFIIADEPTSSIDAVYKNQIIGILQKLKTEFGLTLLLITHDLDLVADISDRMAILYKGVLVEIGRTEEIVNSPIHPYTRSLIDFSRYNYNVNACSLRDYLRNRNGFQSFGCSFKEECDFVTEECRSIHPDQISVTESHSVACHHVIKSKIWQDRNSKND